MTRNKSSFNVIRILKEELIDKEEGYVSVGSIRSILRKNNLSDRVISFTHECILNEYDINLEASDLIISICVNNGKVTEIY